MTAPAHAGPAERAAAARLEELLRPHVVRAWHSSEKRGPRYAVVAGYFDHARELLRVEGLPAKPGALGVGIYERLAVLDAIRRAGDAEMERLLRYCPADAIPVLLCAGTHACFVTLTPAPEGAVVARGGDA